MGKEEDDPEPEQSRSPGVPSTRQSGCDDGSTGSQTDDRGALAGLEQQEGWQIEGEAARVHYSGGTDRYSIEYYDPSECVLYWKVPPEDVGNTAVPVGRNTVPSPLRDRVCEDLAAAGIDPAIEQQTL